MKNLESFIEKHGRCKVVLLPSGNSVIIREQNGEDDDIVSLSSNRQKGIHINLLIARLVVWYEGTDGLINLDQIKSLWVKDKLAILIESRIMSLGNILEFTYDWGEKIGTVKYEEDLSKYIWDYTKPVPQFGEENYFKYRIPKYVETDLPVRFIRTEGNDGIVKTLRFSRMDGYSEEYTATIDRSDFSKNKELIARNLEWNIENEWKKVLNFSQFSAREMRDIRTAVKSFDPDYIPDTELTNPQDPSMIIPINILTIPEFFFPVGR